jgi:glutamate carboxypeptidase
MTRRRSSPNLALALALAVVAAPARAEGLSDGERRVVAYVDAYRDKAEALLEQVVNIPSATENLDGVRAVGKVFEAEFKKVGFTTRWEEMPAAMKRAGHLIAEHPGTLGKRVLLIGHLDTVLEGRPFRRDGKGRASGNGTVDMKGGDVVLLYALKALGASGALEGRQVAVILTGDEEDAGLPIETSRGSMRALAHRSDVALAFEAAVDDTATIARRGVASWSLTVKARTGHSSGIFTDSSGAGAVFEAARILEGFRGALADQPGLTFNASLIVGGTTVGHDLAASRGTAEGKSNVIPGAASVQGDLRFLTDAQYDAAEAAMRAIAARNLLRTSATITFEREYPAMAPTPGNKAILAVLDRASRDLGLGPVKPFDPVQRGAGDISFVAPLLDCLDGLGTTGNRSHTPDEWVDLDALPAQIKRAALLINRLTHDEPGVGKPR